jgi:hypothetical protein
VKTSYILLALLIIQSCSTSEQWNNFEINGSLNKKESFKKLESENEIKMGIDIESPKSKRTTDIIFDESDIYVCDAFFEKNIDTLNIIIGNHSGFSTTGFNIRVLNKTYDILPYSGDDNIGLDEIKSRFENHNQKLILNKENYKAGDSIYGYIEFEKTEYLPHGNVLKHKGVGYFRAKIY